MQNPKLKLFYISQSLAFTYFWLAIAIPYLMYRGLTSAQAFSLMAIYQMMGVVLEYPTGVIGDRFGYHKVTYLANTLNFISMVVLSFNGGYYLYLFALSLLALGNGFSSGNDMGILKSVSSNIKRDTANYNSLMDFVLFISSVIGGLLSKISFELALVVSGLCMFAANIPLFLLKDGIYQQKNNSSIGSIAKDGIRALRSPVLKQLFIIVALYGGYSFTIKSIFGSFGNIYHVDVATIGFLVGLGGLTRSIGGKAYAELQRQNITIPTLLIALSIILMGIYPSYTAVVSLMLFDQLLFGYILSKIDGDLHDLASDHVRASLFSLKRLTMRLIASSYLAVYGIAVGAGQISLIMYGTGIMLLSGVILGWRYLNLRQVQQR